MIGRCSVNMGFLPDGRMKKLSTDTTRVAKRTAAEHNMSSVRD